jgi:hypothetical protein
MRNKFSSLEGFLKKCIKTEKPLFYATFVEFYTPITEREK